MVGFILTGSIPTQAHVRVAQGHGMGTWHKGTSGTGWWGQLVTNATHLSLQSRGRCSPGHLASTSGVTVRQRWPFKGFVSIPVHIFPVRHPLPLRYQLGEKARTPGAPHRGIAAKRDGWFGETEAGEADQSCPELCQNPRISHGN